MDLVYGRDTYRYGIMYNHANGQKEIWREDMTQSQAEGFVRDHESDGGRVGAFSIIRRTISKWEEA